MTDEEKRKRILDEARQRLAGTWIEPEPVASSPVQLEPAEAMRQPAAETYTNDDAWNAWLQHAIDVRLEQERAEMIEILGEVVAKMRTEYQRDTDRDAEINQEFVKIWRSLEQATKSIVEIRREQLERTLFNDDPKAKMN